MRTLWTRYRQFILYALLGAIGAGSDFVVYTLLQRSIHYLLANSISVLVGITVSFLLNASINFKVTDKLTRRFAVFFGVGMAGLFVSNALLFFFIDYSHFDAVLSKAMTLGIVLLLQYSLNKRFSFRTV